MSSTRDPMKVTSSTARRLSIHQGIDRVYEKARDHCQNLSFFQQWYETKLAEINVLREELSIVEQLVLRSSIGDEYHGQAPLVLAVAYHKASEQISNMAVWDTEPGKKRRNEQPNQILKPFRDAMNLAARACLLETDRSKCALGQDEYAEMTLKEKKEMQMQQFASILKFFCSAEDQFLYEPDDALLSNIIGKITNIVNRKTPPKQKSRHVSFLLPKLSSRGTKEEPPSREARESIRKMARSQALVFELIKENEEILKCFFLQGNETLTLCTSGHPLPSQLLHCFYRLVTDILWEKFELDYCPSNYHVKAISRYRNHPTLWKLSSKALFELRVRYESIKDIEQRYLDDLLVKCRAASTLAVQKFTQGCSCGMLFHILLTSRGASVPATNSAEA